jgi:mannonate dehydratase
MFRALLTYKEVGYDGMIMPDHVPTLARGEQPRGDGQYGYNLGAARQDDGHLEAFAFAYGYIRGLIHAVEHTV